METRQQTDTVSQIYVIASPESFDETVTNEQG